MATRPRPPRAPPVRAPRAASNGAATSAWRGRIFLRTGYMLYAGPVAPTVEHAHHAFQLLVTTADPVTLCARVGNALAARAAVIPPDRPHALARGAPSMILLYLDPESAAGRRLAAALDVRDDPEAWCRAGEPLARTIATWPVTLADADALAATMIRAAAGPDAHARVLHPAVTRVLRALPTRLHGDVRTPTLAPIAGLSAGRLSHLFGEQVGIPLRPYVRWLRMLRAAAAMADGANLTTAAHAAGFADAAHLTRTFRRMFGIAPSDVAGHAEWIAAWPDAAPSQ